MIDVAGRFGGHIWWWWAFVRAVLVVFCETTVGSGQIRHDSYSCVCTNTPLDGLVEADMQRRHLVSHYARIGHFCGHFTLNKSPVESNVK